MTQAQGTGTTSFDCPDCHALVSDLAAHTRWHSRLVADLAKAVEHEIHRGSTT